ncbi:hypothetical protein [Halorubrum vacuolatum]|uniref:Competence protein CoiA-like family protein n=1 Tax=Halorubrum vacuolatum TaxID=63740 RepID=A0A238Y112_HALVU|nr:hypothetical protein [Halorubrum vacuolatum]SNR64662.1 hypothetical protein SAMN06264855_12710 [Halorubrum vacuolatum]
MIVALDIDQGVAVSVDEVTHRQEGHYNRRDRYRCLFCGETIEFHRTNNTNDCFHHHDHAGPCVADGNTSIPHRFAQELVAKRIYNLLPANSGLDDIELERRVGDASDFVVVDLLSESAGIAIEIVYKNLDISLKRRLETLFKEGYAVMVMVVTTSQLSPDRLEHHLNQVGAVDVGRVDLTALQMTLGSLMRPDTIDIDAPIWDALPEYLS